MTKTEFRALLKDEKLEFLKSKFDDPEGEFDEMNAEDLLEFGIDNWDEAWENDATEPGGEVSPSDESEDEEGESGPEDEEEGEGAQASDEKVAPYAKDLGSLPIQQRLADRAQGSTDLA